MTRQISQRLPLQVAKCQINIETLHLQYRPLAQFIVSVDYVSDERKTEIHTCCVDLTTPDEILPDNLNIPTNIESKAPQGRNILKIPSKAYKTALDTTLKHVENLANADADEIEEAANARLSEEIDKIEAFYASNWANPNLIAREKQRKIDNAKAKYALTVDIEPVCSTVIYAPELRYVLRVSSQSHPSVSITVPIIYELVRQRVIPPVCDVCRGVIHIGHLCLKGKHIVCDVCYQKCSECPAEQCATHPLERCHICQKSVCSSCVISCPNCGEATCVDHITSCHVCPQPTKVCEKCAIFCSDCKEAHCLKHLEKCAICQKYICDDCQFHCAVCKHPICQFHKEECDECGKPVCEQHAKACIVCGKYHCQTHMEQCHLCPPSPETWICSDCRRLCARCKKITCLSHLYDCPECQTKVCQSCAKFCGDCGKVHCLDHLNTCAVCNKHICRQCSVTCVVCNHTVCHSHQKTCSQCQQTVCEHDSRQCAICQQIYCATHLQQCHICQKQVCSRCRAICEECKKTTCRNHLRKCATCSKIICLDKSCYNRCYIGSEILCKGCTIICSLSGCKKPICSKHAQACHICRRQFCINHTAECAICQRHYCVTDRQNCAHCHQSYCSTCIDDDTGYCYTCESLTNVGRKDSRLKPLLQELSFFTRLSTTSLLKEWHHFLRA